MKRVRPVCLILALAVAAPACLALLPLLGRTLFSPDVYLRIPTFTPGQSDSAALIFWGERFPKTLLAMIAGSGLALAGMTFQTLFRNSLATPYTLGVASGASFGASVFLFVAPVFAGCTTILVPGVTWFALAGAALATAVVYGLARGKDASSERMLLAGVAVSYFFSSMILALQYLADQSRTFQMIRWIMGGIDTCDTTQLTIVALLVGAALVVEFVFARELNLLLTGTERATAWGLAVGPFRLLLFFGTSMTVGAIVAVCGPVAFVGLMVPHLCRLVVGNDHRVLVPTVFLFGAIFLGVCFTISRIVMYPTILPVGILTSLMGGPFFLWLLLRRRERV